MAWAKITIIGAYNYFKDRELGLFDYLRLPEGLDSETLIDTILYKASDFELMHINPDFTRFAIGAFCNKWMPTWEKWAEVLNMEYNPIHNYDRTEEGNDTHTGTQSNSGSEQINTSNTGTSTNDNILAETKLNTGTSEEAHTGTQNTKDIGASSELNTPGKTTETTHENITNGSTTTTNSVAAFNDSNWSNKDKSVVDTNIGKNKDTTTESGRDSKAQSSSIDSTRTDDLSDIRKDNLSEARSGSNKNTRTDDLLEIKQGTNSDIRTDNLKDEHYLRAYGNIGVTSTQQMIEQELELRKFNLYEKISDMFIQEFCLMIY